MRTPRRSFTLVPRRARRRSNVHELVDVDASADQQLPWRSRSRHSAGRSAEITPADGRDRLSGVSLVVERRDD